MRAGSLRSLAWPWLVLAASACSNLLGLSQYEIDPALDPASGGVTSGSGGRPLEGDAGAAAGSTSEAGQSSGGRDAAGAAAGAAGEPPIVISGCQSDQECDDTIDCTIDRCLPDGECQHEPATARCDAGNCETCTAGIGCVAGPKQTKQLLSDPKFDAASSGWKQDGGTSIIDDTRALSSPKLVQLGPAAPDATKALYGDVYQTLTIPKGIAALSLTLNYRFTPGKRETPEEEYAVAALYERNATSPFTEFHQFMGTDAAQPTWKQVTYDAPPTAVARMAGKEFTFDLVAHSFDGIYLFDDLQLDATLCQ